MLRTSNNGLSVDMTMTVVGYAMEATIEVVISQVVQSGLSLSLSSFVDVVDEEIQLFSGLVARPGARFVVAVPFRTTMVLDFIVGSDVVEHGTYGTETRQIKFGAKLNGCARRQIKLKAAVKVTGSCI